MEVLTTLWGAGHGAYLVGGGVRDALLEREVDDWDVASDARPERILSIFAGSTYQNRFGTVLARGIQITTFRRDHRYADHRRPDSVVFSDDIYEDLARRDLTINAIAWGRPGPRADASVVDPHGGRADLDARLVRAVGNPDSRFDEDALRLLRAIRFAARLGFEIEPVTWQAIVSHAAGVRYVSEERIGSEVRGMLAAPGPSRAIRLLRDAGIIAVVMPELDAELRRSEEPLVALDRVAAARPGDEPLALAALLGALEPTDAQSVVARLRLAGPDRTAILELIAAATERYLLTWTDADVRRYMGRVRADMLDDVSTLRRAAAMGDAPAMAREAELRARVAAQRAADAPLTLADLAIDGSDLRDSLGVPESPAIGLILQRLLADVIEEPALNTRPTLLQRAGSLLDGLAGNGPRG